MGKSMDNIPAVHQAFEHVNAFASVAGILPALLGLRQINETTFTLLLGTQIIKKNLGGERS